MYHAITITNASTISTITNNTISDKTMNRILKAMLAATAVVICCWGAAEVPGSTPTHLIDP